MAGFSSQGPTDVDFRVKPDVVAPGVNVLSSIPDNGWAFFQGTSMATPYLAGTAAVVIGMHLSPRWSAAQVRSAIVNTATQGVLKRFTNATPPRVDDVNIVGAGLDNVLAAVNAKVALDPVSSSFGAVPSGSGQSAANAIAVSNLLGSAASVEVVDGYHAGSAYGVTFAASLNSAHTLVTVTMNAAKGAVLGDHEATLLVKDGGGNTIAHAVLYAFVK